MFINKQVWAICLMVPELRLLHKNRFGTNWSQSIFDVLLAS
jgi:hypothetical protein